MDKENLNTAGRATVVLSHDLIRHGLMVKAGTKLTDVTDAELAALKSQPKRSDEIVEAGAGAGDGASSKKVAADG